MSFLNISFYFLQNEGINKRQNNAYENVFFFENQLYSATFKSRQCEQSQVLVYVGKLCFMAIDFQNQSGIGSKMEW